MLTRVHRDSTKRIQSSNTYTTRADIPLSGASDTSWHKFNGLFHEPDNNCILTVMHHLHDMANAAFSISDSIQKTTMKQKSGHLIRDKLVRAWSLQCDASRGDVHTNEQSIPSSILRISTRGLGSYSCQFGPRKSSSNFGNDAINIELQLLPKSKLSLGHAGTSNDCLTASVENVADELVSGLRQALSNREFTSGVSWYEAAVKHLQESFRHSVLGQHIELKEIRIMNTYTSSDSIIKWRHESSVADPFRGLFRWFKQYNGTTRTSAEAGQAPMSVYIFVYEIASADF